MIETCCYWMQIIQLHDAPFYFLIKVVKALCFSAVLILKHKVFQNNRTISKTIRLDATWFVLGIFKFNLYLFRTTRLFFFISKKKIHEIRI